MQRAIHLASAEETQRLGHLLGQLGEPGTTLALNGDLGAGKTCLAQGVARGLGVTGPVTSPTFQILREYQGPGGQLQHADLYRLGDESELQELGLDELLGVTGVSVVEWAERFEQVLPDDRLEVQLSYGHAGGRDALLIALGPRSERLLCAVQDRLTMRTP